MNRTALFSLLFLPVFGLAQNRAAAHFDRPFYVSGESVWFKIYLPESVENQKFNVRFELFDEKGSARATAFLPKKGGEKGQPAFCEGHFSVPFDLETGLFRFRFSALDSLAGAVELVAAAVPVFNDLAENGGAFSIQKTAAEASFLDQLEVKIEFEKGPPVRGEKAAVRISAFEKNGQKVAASASVAVIDAVLTKGAFDGPTLFFGPDVPENPRFLSGIWRGGSVFLKNEKPLVTPLLPVVDCETGALEFASTDEKGHFWLRLPDFSGAREWQILEREGRKISVVWDKSIAEYGLRITDFSDAAQSVIRNPYSAIEDILQLSRQRKKIYSLFGTVETEPIFEKTAVEKRAVEARKTYAVQDFERFRTMHEFFREVSTLIRFEEKKEGFEARLYNTSRMAFFERAPLFVVDGRATFDADFVGKIDPATVRRVDLITDFDVLKKAFPALGAGGAVIIESVKGPQNLPPDQQKNVFSLPGLAFSTRFPIEKGDSKKPKIGPSVFWQPDFLTSSAEAAAVKLEKNAEPSRLEFWPSDDRSRFQIEVVACSADGKMGRARLEWSPER